MLTFKSSFLFLGVVQSSQNSLEGWTKQILHVWASSRETANVLKSVYTNSISDALKQNTVVLITVAEDADVIFMNTLN